MDAGAAVIHPTTHFSCVNGMASRIHKDAVKPRTPCRQSVLPKKKTSPDAFPAAGDNKKTANEASTFRRLVKLSSVRN
jgi:hypothetical protein